MVTCYIANTEEEGQQCGQKFANDKDIVAVVSRPDVHRNGVVLRRARRIQAGGRRACRSVAVDTSRRAAAVLYGGAKYILAPYATFARDTLKAKSAALVYPEGSGQDEGAAGQASAFEAAGIPIKVVSYPANTPDLTVPLLAAGAQNVDLVMPVINPNDCVKFEQAIQQLGIPDEKVLASPICINADVVAGLSVTSPSGSTPSPRRSASTRPIPSVPPYTDILKAQGQEKQHR